MGTNTLTTNSTSYLDLWRGIDPQMSFSGQLAFIMGNASRIRPEECYQASKLLVFIKAIALAISNIQRGQENKMVLHLMCIGNTIDYVACKIEHLYLLQKMIKEADLEYAYDLNEMTVTISRSKPNQKQTVICDGCQTQDEYAHVCFKDRAEVNGKQTDRSCDCPICIEHDLFMALRIEDDEYFNEKLAIINKLEAKKH